MSSRTSISSDRQNGRNMSPHHRSSRAVTIWMSLCAVLAVTTVTACGPEDTAAVPTVPAAFSKQKLHWAACPAPSTAQGAGDEPEDLPDGTRWQCTTMEVPLDYAHPGSETIDLALIRAKAAPGAGEKRLGSLVFNFGGPGGSGVSTLPAFAADEYMKLHERYDLVSFDPRGVGDSAGVRCLDAKAMDAWLDIDRTPDIAAEEEAYSLGMRGYTQACEQNSGKMLRHVDTQDAARDLDLMRQVLGDEKLHYFGISYGTQLGGVYANLFPEKVGRTVFDAVVDPTEGPLESALGQTKGFQKALRNFLKDCSEQDSCFFKGEDVAQGEKEILKLLKSIDANPLPTEFGRTLTQSLALNGIAAALYDQEGWLFLRAGLAEAAQGQGTALLVLSDAFNDRLDDGRYSNINAANTAINCADYKARFTADDVRRHLPTFRKDSPVFGDWMAWALLQCTDWPVAGYSQTIDVEADGAAPVLVVGNTGDPATPYEGAKKMADELGRGVGVQITVKGEGHGTYGSNRCLTDMVDRYLLNGTVPENGVTCS